MRSIKSIVVALLLMIAATVNAQSKAKVIAVVNRADWCPVCQANGERVMKDVFPNYMEPSATIVMNDLTNDKSKAASKAALKRLGVYQLVANDKMTGEIIFIDPKTKKVLNKVSVAKSNEELKAAFDEAIKAS